MIALMNSDWLQNTLRMFSARNELLQIAVLPWRERKGEVEICMVTSRGGGRWILPKGWPEKHLSHADAAAQEAWEEAGLKGAVEAESCGNYQTYKSLDGGIGVAVRMEVYMMTDPKQSDIYPEAKKRKVKWLALDQAIARASEDGLKKLLQELKASERFSSERK